MGGTKFQFASGSKTSVVKRSSYINAYLTLKTLTAKLPLRLPSVTRLMMDVAAKGCLCLGPPLIKPEPNIIIGLFSTVTF